MKISKLVQIPKQTTIIDVMSKMNEAAVQFAIVIDEKERLIGLVTDGDIRRGFLAGVNAEESVARIMNARPTVASAGLEPEAMVKLLSERISFIPVVNSEGLVQGVLTYKDEKSLSDIRSRTVCVLGLGYVGLTLSVVLAEKGFQVVGYDLNRELIEGLEKKIPPFYEMGIQTYLNRYIGNKLTVTTDLDAVKAQTYILTVGTPLSDDRNTPNIEYIRLAAESIGKKLQRGDLVILRSTVPVGTTRAAVIPILQNQSGLMPGIDFYIAFAPERTIEGRALNELKSIPQIVGGFDERSQALASKLFSEVTQSIVEVESLEAAEMAKILNNTFRDVKFAYSNQMAQICKQLNLDAVKIIEAANQGYLRDPIPLPSPGVGGACLSKDTFLLNHSCKNIESQPELALVARKINDRIPASLAQEVKTYLQSLNVSRPKIFVIGLAFKGEPETSDMRDSTTLQFIDHLKTLFQEIELLGYDPVVPNESLSLVGVEPVSLSGGFEGAHLVAIMNNHREYQDMDIYKLLSTAHPRCMFLDGWHLFEPEQIKSIHSVHYTGVGFSTLNSSDRF